MRMWVVEGKRGGHIGQNIFDSRAAAELALQYYARGGNVDDWRIREVYPVSSDVVEGWLARQD